MTLDDAGRNFKFLVRDRDSKFTRPFDAVFAGAGIRVLRTPPQAPRANAFAERWIGTARRECLDRLLIINQRHLIAIVDEYMAHYNTHRPHQSLNQVCPLPRPRPAPRRLVADHGPPQPVERKEVLGGLIHEYRHAA